MQRMPGTTSGYFDGKFNLVKSLPIPRFRRDSRPMGSKYLTRTCVRHLRQYRQCAGGIHRRIRAAWWICEASGLRRQAEPTMGMALAPNNFGPFSNALLVSNNLPNAPSMHSISILASSWGSLRTLWTNYKYRPAMGISVRAAGRWEWPQESAFLHRGPNNYANGRLE